MYSDKVIDHFQNPRNVGEIEDASGVGTVGNAKCGDMMRLYLKINEHGKGIEINTGSLYKNMTYAHPHPSILKLYKELGGEIITVGSDAHVPKYIGYDFETYARDILTATGFRYYCTFEQLKPVFHKL